MIVIAIYTRKSRATDTGESIENQIKICLEYIEKNFIGEDVKVIYYGDGEGKSGADTSRKDFQRLINDSKKKIYNVLMCYRLDRVARSVADFSDLIEGLREHNISFISVKEQFDTSTPMGRAMMYIASVFAQLEREIAAERVKDNLIELAKSGRWLGGVTPVGYNAKQYETLSIKQINADNEVERKRKKAFTLEKEQEEIEQMNLIFSKMLELKSLTAVEAFLVNHDIKTRTGTYYRIHTLKSIYSNIVYAKNDQDMYDYLTDKNITIYPENAKFDGNAGIIAYGKTKQEKNKPTQRKSIDDWIVSVGKHPGYLSGKEWIEIQNIMKRNENKRYRMPRRNEALLTSTLVCKKCGHFMRPKLVSGRKETNGKPRFFYLCELKDISKKQKCDVKNVDGNKLDELLEQEIKKWSAPNSKVVEELKKIASQPKKETEENLEIKRLKKLYEKNDKSITNLVDKIKYIDIELMEDISNEIKRLKKENIKIQENINNLILKNKNDTTNMDIQDSEVAKLVLDVIKNYFESFGKMDLLTKRELLKIFIESATWDDESEIVEVNLLNTECDYFFLDTLFPTGTHRQCYSFSKWSSIKIKM